VEEIQEQKLRLIKELAPKPSDAIKAMLEGLRTLPGDDFVVRMHTFGDTTSRRQDGEWVDICCGCAATCAVHRLAHKKPDLEHIMCRNRSPYLGLHFADMRDFEDAIDEFRKGNVSQLFWYYGLASVDVSSELWSKQLWFLQDSNWEEQLPMIEEYVKKLVAAGL
jgi:hypothetical protein